VLNSDNIDPELRMVLLGCLEAFRRAIADYLIRGAEGLRKAAATTLGELLIARDNVRANEKHPLMQRLWGFLTKVNTAVSLAKHSKPLVDWVQLAVTGEAPPPSV
jgi:hypothetical protein